MQLVESDDKLKYTYTVPMKCKLYEYILLSLRNAHIKPNYANIPLRPNKLFL